MDLNTYISQFSLNEIIKIEESDLQFLYLKNSWENIKKTYGNEKVNQNVFLFLILQNSIVSYQIAGSGELWWEEFSKKIYEDFDILKETISNKNDNIKWRHSFLTNSKYNKRLYNLKTNRLKKFDVIKLDLSIFEDGFSFINHYNDMENLFEILKKTLNSDGKTVCFAIKMFGYGSRIVFEKFNYYPKSIKIPIDSRLKKIYSSQNTNLDIKDFFEKLSNDHKIPALHLDSLLRINYRKMVAVPTKNQQK